MVSDQTHLSAAAVPLPLVSASLGMGLGLLLLSRNKTTSLKPITTAVKIADGVLKSSSSPYRALLLTLKFIFKAHQRFFSQQQNSAAVINRKQLKTVLIVGNLARYYGKLIHAQQPLIGFGFITNVYKISMNSIKLLEGFVGLQLSSGLREGIKVAGTIVRAVAVAAEIQRRVAKYVASRYGVVRFRHSRSFRVCSCCYCWYPGVRVSGLSSGLEYDDSYVDIVERSVDRKIFELLSLALPISSV